MPGASPDAIGIATWCLDPSAPDALVRAAALGFRSVHVDFGSPAIPGCLDSGAAIDTLRRLARQQGATLLALALNFVNEVPLDADAAAGDGIERGIRAAVTAAGQLDIPVVVVPSFEQAAIRNDDALRQYARRVRCACIEAASSGTTMVASETPLGARDLLRLAALVDHPRFRILLDTQNPAIAGHDAVEIVEQVSDLLWPEVHVKDGAGGMGNRPLGAGDSGLARTLRAAVRAGFARTWILESEWSSGDAGWLDDRRRLETMLAAAGEAHAGRG
ncbi:MAG: sugar phosphate isomerase/epimerase family protein [Vicinamibacterales bacterium]